MTKLTGLFPAISLVPAGTEVRMMFLPRPLMLKTVEWSLMFKQFQYYEQFRDLNMKRKMKNRL